MSTEHRVTETLDVKGLNCPMPVVKAKQAVDGLESGDVLEIVATDPGSVSDIEGWANATGSVKLLEQDETDEDGETVYRHYVRRTDA
ncbi:sulfurtransferase TusA family protein [Halosolutus halophilus]|uniref:sulfurtransferase TusA family protein n=1 Tax=Halosolutus halophilus TaxID=1552990 RepID=UPI002234EF8E|nr:sulfurtransferase TusA family protein [Halosolutus halophilus]